MTRRGFAGAGSAALLLRGQARKYRTALIGSGWWGMNILGEAMASGECQITALCDVDENQLRPAREKAAKLSGDQPRTYKDYREMLRKERPEICIVATPDHWHPLAMIEAVKQGAHVYVEKPVSHTLREGRAMVNAARASNRVVQVGTHRRVSPHNISAMEFLRAGKLGRVGMVRAFVHSGGGAGVKSPDTEAPAGLDWDFWCGPAPLRPYNKAIHPRGFRQFMDYANGTIGDWGIHWFDQILWWTEEKYPKKIHSTAARRVKQDSSDAPDTQVATFEFESFTCVWEHRLYAANNAESASLGVYFYGTEGTLHLGWRDGWTFHPADRKKPSIHENPTLHEPDTQNIKELWADFLGAIKAGRRPACDIETGHRSTSMSLLANASVKAGQSLAWDGEKETITNAPRANALLSRTYRAPWKYPQG
ncbi:MAG: Gfo/Idh/MocA family oxidoreductase [Candidatus Solibacter usitatus]|nr:Gfo/Idh/MocA family oxidoreductase [Candidatus Solibacter usitatus]